ncbi:hypothetical protein JOQ06_019814, partial [Pogonophryne albipinna]
TVKFPLQTNGTMQTLPRFSTTSASPQRKVPCSLGNCVRVKHLASPKVPLP